MKTPSRLVCYLTGCWGMKQAVQLSGRGWALTPRRAPGPHRLEDTSRPHELQLGPIEATHLWVKLNYRYPVTMELADCQPAVQAAFEAAGWALDGQVHKEKLYYPAETPLVSAALLEVY